MNDLMDNDMNTQSDSNVQRRGRGGFRPGAGRPKGNETEEMKERRRIERAMKLRIARSTDRLLNSQMQLAQGESSLYHVYYTGSGKERKKVVEIVTDQEVIEAYLADDLETDGDFYYIATKSADNRAIDSLLDRTYGKSQQSVDLTSKGERLPTVIIEGVYGSEPNFRPSDSSTETNEVAEDSNTVES